MRSSWIVLDKQDFDLTERVVMSGWGNGSGFGSGLGWGDGYGSGDGGRDG